MKLTLNKKPKKLLKTSVLKKVNNDLKVSSLSKTSPLKTQIPLHTVFGAGYGSPTKTAEMLQKGYQIDTKLSNDNQQVWYNPKDNKLIYNVAGTHNIKDIGTDFMLAAGRLKKTKRYKEAEDTLKNARQKYQGSQVVVTGHSLGGTIGSYLTSKSKGDEFYGYNSGYTIGQKSRSYNGKQHHYRTEGDIVSLAGKGAKNMTTLNNPHKFKYDFLKAHHSENLQKKPILI